MAGATDEQSYLMQRRTTANRRRYLLHVGSEHHTQRTSRNQEAVQQQSVSSEIVEMSNMITLPAYLSYDSKDAAQPVDAMDIMPVFV